jgi:hypothetical protein
MASQSVPLRTQTWKIACRRLAVIEASFAKGEFLGNACFTCHAAGPAAKNRAMYENMRDFISSEHQNHTVG